MENTRGEVILIQLFSFATMSYRGAEGGHLGYQQDLFKRLPENERPRTVWCYPKDEPGVCTIESNAATEQDTRHLAYLREIERGVQYWNTQQLLDALLTRSPSALPELYIESEKINLELSRQMREEIERLWCEKYPIQGSWRPHSPGHNSSVRSPVASASFCCSARSPSQPCIHRSGS